MQAVTPLNVARKPLSEMSSEKLFDVNDQLTHKIHGTAHPDRKTHLREQRALVRAEVLRRIPGGAR